MTLKTVKTRQMLNTAMDGLSVLIEHESNALDNLRKSLSERWTVAGKARGIGELLRDQIDLVPDTQSRLMRDQQLRSELLRGFRRDLKQSLLSSRA